MRDDLKSERWIRIKAGLLTKTVLRARKDVVASDWEEAGILMLRTYQPTYKIGDCHLVVLGSSHTCQ